MSKGVNEFTSGAMHFGGLVCYRFIRLTAPYIYTLGLVTVTMKYFASNSVFEPPTQDHVRYSKLSQNQALIFDIIYRSIAPNIGGETSSTLTLYSPCKICACFGVGI